MTTNDINAISETPEYKEALTSQSQAIHLCMRLGYTLLTPAEADDLRDGRTSDVLLSKVTQRFLKKYATISVRNAAGTRSRDYDKFSDTDIYRGMQILRTVDDTAGAASPCRSSTLSILKTMSSTSFPSSWCNARAPAKPADSTWSFS